MKVSLVYSPAPRQVREWNLVLAAGASVEQALAASLIFEAFPELLTAPFAIGIWGRKSSLAHQLHDKDRVEIYRGLRVDPKVARRERFNRQGVKSAGLFSKTRAGAKAGY
ncbi:MAG: RnfH family protein [Polaromonas sp.]|uniref:RnfH family protein n=1 Tax=Polaromonas sp. TaxID=1869339 RepID=UPI00272F50FA|nr:RnfH family protein [Polaromonas sp.]MDP2255354.1 RnfH family protein [Polaromonas sp.]MDP3709098.1 RnfH family protein [Polaromonas sp.]